MLPDNVAKPQVKAGEVDTNDNVRFPFKSEREQPAEQDSKLPVTLNDLPKPHHRVLGHVHLERDTGVRHMWAARTEEIRLEAGVRNG